MSFGSRPRIAVALAAVVALCLSGCGSLPGGGDSGSSKVVKAAEDLAGGKKVGGVAIIGDSVGILDDQLTTTPGEGFGHNEFLTAVARVAVPTDASALDLNGLADEVAALKDTCGGKQAGRIVSVPGSAKTVKWVGCFDPDADPKGQQTKGTLSLGGKALPKADSWFGEAGLNTLWSLGPQLVGSNTIASVTLTPKESNLVVRPTQPSAKCPDVNVQVGIQTDGTLWLRKADCATFSPPVPNATLTDVTKYPASGVAKNLQASMAAQQITPAADTEVQSAWLKDSPTLPLLQVTAGSKKVLVAQSDADQAKLKSAQGLDRKSIAGQWPTTLAGGWQLESSGRGKQLPSGFYAYTKGADGVYVMPDAASEEQIREGMTNIVTKGEALCGLETNTGKKLPKCFVRASGKTWVQAFRNIHYPATIDQVAEVANAFYAAMK